MTTKHCLKCKETKDVAEFGRNATRPDGLQFYCKKCTNAMQAALQAKRKAQGEFMMTAIRASREARANTSDAPMTPALEPAPSTPPTQPTQTKYCPKCKETKDVAEFSRDTAKKDGIRTYCQACTAAASAAYRERQRIARSDTLAANYRSPVEEAHTKVCPKCKQTKGFAEFGRNVSKADGMQTYCKACAGQLQKLLRSGERTGDTEAAPVKPAPTPAHPPDPMKQRLAQQRDHIQRITTLAFDVHKWACDIKDAHEKETNEGHAYFTVPEVQEQFHISLATWNEVKDQMMRLGLSLGFEPFRGHYIGAPGSQATVITDFLRRSVSAIERLAASIEATQASREWDVVRAELKENSPLRLDSIPRLMRGAGLKVDSNLERLLLDTPKTD